MMERNPSSCYVQSAKSFFFFFTFQPQEMLQELTKYLRMTYYYCVWCGTSFAGTSYFNVAYGNCLCSILILKGLAYLLAISSNCPGNESEMPIYVTFEKTFLVVTN